MIKVKKLTKEVKASLVYTIASLFTKSIGIITLPFFTNVLTTSEVGLSNLYNSWYSIIFVLTSLSLCSSAYNIGLLDFKEERDKFTLSMIYLSSLSTIVLFIVYFFMRFILNDVLTLTTPLMIFMFIMFFFEPAYDFWMAKQRFEYKYKSSAIVSVIYGVSTALFSILCIYLMKNGNQNLGEVKIYSSGFIKIVIGLFFVMLFFIKGIHKPTLKYWKYVIPITLPLIVHTLAKHILDVSDKTMISSMIGQDAVGIYSTLYTISSLSLILWSAINGSLIPYMFEKLKDENNAKKSLNSVIIFLLIFYSVFAISMTFVAPEIVKILTNEEYANAVYLIPPIAAGIFLTAVYNIYGNVLAYKKKTYFIMITTIVAALSNIILNFIFIPKFGYIAASYTTLFGFVELSILMFLFSKISYKKNFVNNLYILIVSLMTIGICLFCNILYPFIIFRYIFIAIIFILLIIFRKKIISFMKKIKNKE